MADQHIYSPETIIKAYSLGLFPMADSHDSHEIKFYDPDQRALIPIDNTLGRGVHIPRRLQRRVRQAPYAVTINQDFTAVIDACATLVTNAKTHGLIEIFADSISRFTKWDLHIQSKFGWTGHW